MKITAQHDRSSPRCIVKRTGTVQVKITIQIDCACRQGIIRTLKMAVLKEDPCTAHKGTGIKTADKITIFCRDFLSICKTQLGLCNRIGAFFTI